MVVVAVVLVERLMAREKRRQELRLRAAVQNETSKPLPMPQGAPLGEVKPKPPRSAAISAWSNLGPRGPRSVQCRPAWSKVAHSVEG